MTVCLTFDVDAESGWLGQGIKFRDRLTTLSEGRYGVTRGLPRILALLGELEITATFYVPGLTAELHPEVVPAILSAGHEIGHHGYRHLSSDGLSEQQQAEELDLATEVIRQASGIVPRGYRSPSWEMTPETFRLLCERDFAYDSSMMGDDRPYREHYGDRSILELPVHWSLDDWPFFAWSEYLGGGHISSPVQWAGDWYREFEVAKAESRPLTYTMHPEAIGRGYLTQMLERVITGMRERGRPWFATHARLAALATAQAID